MKPLGHVARRSAPALALRGGRGAILAAALLTALATGEAVGQPGGLFREAAPMAAVAGPDLSAVSDSVTLRRRLVAIDFGQLVPSADTAATVPGGAAAAPSGALTLNLFDDASFTGLVRSVAPTFSGGYSLSGPLAGVEMGTMTLVVNGDVVAGSVRTPEATYRVRPAGAGLHAVSEVDPSRLPRLGEPIPGRGWEDEARPPFGPDGGFPVPFEPRPAPQVPAAFRATEDAPRADTQGSIAADRAALQALYDATDGSTWTNSTNWKTDAPLDQWYGVTMHQGRVWGVDLHDNALAGSIPSDLGSLTNVRWLFLSSNALTGAIPGELGSLGNLESLSLWENELTGSIPAALGNLTDLEWLALSSNELTGRIPAELGRLANLEYLSLGWNELTGSIPAALGNLTDLEVLRLSSNELTGSTTWLENLTNLEWLNLSANWGVTGALPASLELPSLERLNIFFTQTCAPAAWREWLKTIDFSGRLCEPADATIDVAVVYTPAAREGAGGTAAIEAVIDLQVAEANGAYDASGVRHRVALTAREEVAYVETGDSRVDIDRLADPADGHMDGVHDLRDRIGADLVSLVVDHSDFGGRGQLPGVFSLVTREGGGRTFAHELGHNMGLLHDRWQVHHNEEEKVLQEHPAYGYVNQRAFEAGAPKSSRWITVMAYWSQCNDADLFCQAPLRFSSPRQSYNGDPLGVAQGEGSGVRGPADAVVVLNATGPAVALWRDRPSAVNRPPSAAGTLPDRALTLNGSLTVDVSSAFIDPDGDALTYAVSSSAPAVVTVRAAGTRVTLTAIGEGTATIRVTATDSGGLSASQSFTVTVGTSVSVPFTDDPIRPGVTPVRAVHFTELRTRVDGLRTAVGLARFAWTDPVLTAEVTRVRLVHLLELRSALAAAYAAAGRPAPRWTDTAPVGGSTPIRAAHLTELRAAVVALE